MTPDTPLRHPTMNLREDVRLDLQLARVSGLGRVSAIKYLSSLWTNPEHSWNRIPSEKKVLINQFLAENGSDEYPLEVRLKSQRMNSIRQLMRTKCYRGMRHKLGKRVRNQRTRTSNRVNRVVKGFQKKKGKNEKTAI